MEGETEQDFNQRFENLKRAHRKIKGEIADANYKWRTENQKPAMVAEKYRAIFDELLQKKHGDYTELLYTAEEAMCDLNVKHLWEEYRTKNTAISKPRITWEEERGGTGRHVEGTACWLKPEEGETYRKAHLALASKYYKLMKQEREKIDVMSKREEKTYRSAIHKQKKASVARKRLAKQIGLRK